MKPGIETNDFNQALKIAKDVIDTAKDLNKLETGVLFASTAGFIALAFLLHVAFWVFASMTAALLLYRLIIFYNSRKEAEIASSLQVYDSIMRRKQDLWKSDLPQDEKRQLSEHLNDISNMTPQSEPARLPSPQMTKQLKIENSKYISIDNPD